MYFILSLIPLFILIYFKSRKSMHMLQQNYYDESKRYFYWITKNLKKVFLTVDIFLIISIICLMLNETVSYIFFASLSFFLTVLYCSHKEQVKKPLVVTARIKRLFTTLTLIHIIILTIIMLTFNKNYIAYYYLGLSLLTYLNYFVILIVNKINIPVEKCVYLKYKHQAMKKV